jgi:hypothetical protein
MKLGGERLRAQESVSKCLQCEMSANRASEAWGAFYSPPRESSRWGVRNPDMFGSGAGHVRSTSLKAGLGIGYIRSGTWSLRNWVRLDMSGLGQTCPRNASGILPRSRTCLVNSGKG